MLNLPMGSSIKIMLGFEHKRFKPPALNNMHADRQLVRGAEHACRQRLQEALACEFPEEPYINDMGYNAYIAIYLYKADGRDRRSRPSSTISAR